MKLKIFLDTTALLRGFALWRMNGMPPAYLTDVQAKRHTFEKCIFEAYMTFRGVGGKKPSEGRGDWAQRHLCQDQDPASLSKLASKYHDGNTFLALYWVNQVLEAGTGASRFAELAAAIEDPAKREELLDQANRLLGLVSERHRFENLCNAFWDYLSSNHVAIIPYIAAFDSRREDLLFLVDPHRLDGFARDTILPSEDFEIIYAATTLPADIFVTDDKHLIRCAASLGLNLPISQWHFCQTSEYEEKVREVLEFRNT